MSDRVRIIAIALACSIMAAGTARSEDGGAPSEDLEKTLNRDVKANWIMSVTDLGDIILFGGAITVPVHRPSVERCGEWITIPLDARAKANDDLQKEAEKTANDQKLSKSERLVFKRKKLAPYKACEADFRKRCDEAKAAPADTRKAAVTQARKGIEEILNAKDQASAKSYLTTVLKQCPLEE